MNQNKCLLSNSVSDLDDIGRELIKTYPDQRLFALYGEMGAGKTTFIKALCKYLQVEDQVSSPTFAIVNVYRTSGNEQVNHFDFYRIKTIEEAYDIGYEDYFFGGSYCFIEWPEKLETLLPEETIKVIIEVDKSSGQRKYKF